MYELIVYRLSSIRALCWFFSRWHSAPTSPCDKIQKTAGPKTLLWRYIRVVRCQLSPTRRFSVQARFHRDCGTEYVT